MNRLFYTLILSLVMTSGIAQSTIRGKVSDASNGESVPFANVILNDGSQFVAQSDFDGNYTIEGVTAGTYTLKCSFVGLQDFSKEVTVDGSGVEIVNVVMLSNEIVVGGDNGEGAVIVAKLAADRTAVMDKAKAKKAESMDFISRQQIQSTGDGNATDAFKRVPGVSTVGDYIFVRGLSDRYLKTNLNGAAIPSMDPRRNTVEMDLFPTQLVDNLMVIKTASPRYPADWAGAFISVETRDYPDQFMFNYSASLGFNSQASFREILSSRRSDTDWLGYDNGMRDIPTGLPGTDQWPNQEGACFYDQIIFAGEQLGMDYAASMAEFGVNGCNDINNGLTTLQEVLDQLNIPDVDSQVDLTDQYYSATVTANNSELTEAGQAFGNTWQNTRMTAGPDMSHSLSFGNQTKLFGRTFGYIAGLQYKRSYRYYEDGTYGRYFLGTSTDVDSLVLQKLYNEERGTENVYWNALLNLSYKFNDRNSLTFLAMPNFSGQNISRTLDGINPKDHEEFQLQRLHRYSERNMNIFQLRGNHDIKGTDAKLTWITSYSKGRQNVPDLKLFSTNYWEQTNTSYFDENTGEDITEQVVDAIDYLEGEYPNFDWENASQAEIYELIQDEFEDIAFDTTNVALNTDTLYNIEPSLYPSPTRYYRELEETIWDSKVELELPFATMLNSRNRLYFGLQYTDRERSVSERLFSFVESGGLQFDGDFESYYAPENYVVDSDGFLVVKDATDLVNTNTGTQKVFATYAGGDVALTERFRMNGGVRMENVDMVIESAKINDPGLGEAEKASLRGALDGYDILPSVNLIYQLGNLNELLKTTNLRLSYSQSIARPVFREKSPLRAFDFETLEVLTGNVDLESTQIENFDFRLERFLGFGQIYSISAFYKRFQGAIEQQIVTEANNIEITWDNVASSRVYGLEFEVRKKLDFISPKLDPLSLGLNVSLIKSETDIPELELAQLRVGDPDQAATRPMFGQSPYIINAIAAYANDSIGLNVALAYNVQGEKLVLVTKGLTPDIYEQPRPMLDLSVRKTLGERFGVQFKIRNMLNAPVQRSYEFKDVMYDWTNFTTGTNYQIGIQYRITGNN